MALKNIKNQFSNRALKKLKLLFGEKGGQGGGVVHSHPPTHSSIIIDFALTFNCMYRFRFNLQINGFLKGP